MNYKGQSRDLIKSGSSIIFVFLLGLVVVFLVLAEQFESYVYPFVIVEFANQLRDRGENFLDALLHAANIAKQLDKESKILTSTSS